MNTLYALLLSLSLVLISSMECKHINNDVEATMESHTNSCTPLYRDCWDDDECCSGFCHDDGFFSSEPYCKEL